MRPSVLLASLTICCFLPLAAGYGQGVPSAVRARQLGVQPQFPSTRDAQKPAADGAAMPLKSGLKVRPVQDSQSRTFADDSGPALGDSVPFGERDASGDDAPATSDPPFGSAGPVFPNAPETIMEPDFEGAGVQPLVPAVPNAPAAASANRDFWIVSSRHCAQQGNQTALNCGLGYFRCDRGGTPTRCDEAAFRQSLQPGVPVCIVVHGSFTNWETVCEDACATNRWLHAAAPHLPMQMVFYSWPSDPATVVLPPIDVEIMGTRAAFNGMYLSQLIQRIPSNSPVCLMGHSHGARAISSCLHLMAGGDVQGYRYPNPRAIPHRIRTVFVAGAVDHHWLLPSERYGLALSRTEGLLNIRNSQDLALGFYSWRGLFAGTAVGREGLSARDRQCLGQYVARIREIDVSPLLGDEHLWPAYVRRPEIATACVPYVYFVDDPSAGTMPGVTAPAVNAPIMNAPTPVDQARRNPFGNPYVQRYQPLPDPQRNAVVPPANTMNPTNVPPNGSPYAGAPATAAGANRAAPAAAAGAIQPPRWNGWSYAGQPGGQYPARNVAPTAGTPTSVPYRPAAAPNAMPGGAVPYQARPAAPQSFPSTPSYQPSPNAPARLGLPETSSTTPRPLDGAEVTRTNAPRSSLGGSLQPIERPRLEPFPSQDLQPADSVRDLEPNLDATEPVRIDSKPFERPRNKVPSILRRYYPEASRGGDDPAT